MSAIASFFKLPIGTLEGLQNATIPRKRFLGPPKDAYHDFIQANGQEVAKYPWSGFVLAVLLPYLEEVHHIDLMKSEYDELASFLTQAREATHFIFTSTHKQAFLAALDASFSESDLEAYFNDFTQTSEIGVGKAMLEGIHAFRQALASVDGNSVILFSIG